MLFSIDTTARNRSLRGHPFQRRKLSEQNPKPRRTFQNSQSRRRSHPEKKPKRKTSSILCCLQHIPSPKTSRLGDRQFIRQKLSQQNPKPGGTLPKTANQEEKKPDQKPKKKKRAAFRAVLARQKPRTNSKKKTQQILPTPHLTERKMQDPTGSKKQMPILSGLNLT